MTYRANVPEVRAGVVTLTVSDLTKAITFTTAMPDTNYAVQLGLEGNVAAVFWITSKTTTGFTLNVSLGVAAAVSWIAARFQS